jgi:hypothetical protein
MVIAMADRPLMLTAAARIDGSLTE